MFSVVVKCMFVDVAKRNGNLELAYVRIDENGKRWLSEGMRTWLFLASYGQQIIQWRAS